jgi:hypothetical protein
MTLFKKGEATMNAPLQWKQVGADWRLFHARRIVGRAVPDAKHDGMWRVKLPGGLSDMVNLSRAKDAAREFAIRQIERRANAAKFEEKVIQNQGAFSPPKAQVRLNRLGVSEVGSDGKTHPRAQFEGAANGT